MKRTGRLARLEPRVTHIGLNEHASGLPIGPDEKIFHPDLGRGQQFHRVPYPAYVVDRAGSERDVLLAARRGQQRHSVDRLHRRIQHAYGQAVGRAGLQRVGYIKLEGVLRAFVFADANPIQPDLRIIVHGEKAENETPVRMRVGSAW